MMYDDFGARFKKEYEVFLFALAGRYLLMIAPGAEVSPMMINNFKADAASLRETFLRNATRSVATFTDNLSNGGDTELSDAFAHDLQSITMQNIQQLVAAMKGLGLSASKTTKDAHGGLGLLIQRKMETPDFTIKTESGRRFKAQDLVRSTAREFAYRQWLYDQLEVISETTDLAQVAYDDPDHVHHGVVFSISGETEGRMSRAWAERVVFHYNSTAMVRPYVRP